MEEIFEKKIDETSWIDPKVKKPIQYDLVKIKTLRGNFTGWWTGNYWYGLKIKSSDQILKWKRIGHSFN